MIVRAKGLTLNEQSRQLAAAKRILILGSSGSGKTSLAIRLGDILHIPLIHLDAHFWQPGWVSTPQEEWRAQVEAMVQQPCWIMDGTYERTLDVRLPAADAVICVECSRYLCLWRVLKRKLTVDDLQRPDAPAGQILDRSFLRYIWQYPAVTRPLVWENIREFGAGKIVIQLGGGSEIRQFVQLVQQAVGPG
jgi:adenylate kinase family enzyme